MYFVFFSRANIILEDAFFNSVFIVIIPSIRFNLEIMPFIEKFTAVDNVVVGNLVALIVHMFDC